MMLAWAYLLGSVPNNPNKPFTFSCMACIMVSCSLDAVDIRWHWGNTRTI